MQEFLKGAAKRCVSVRVPSVLICTPTQGGRARSSATESPPESQCAPLEIHSRYTRELSPLRARMGLTVGGGASCSQLALRRVRISVRRIYRVAHGIIGGLKVGAGVSVSVRSSVRRICRVAHGIIGGLDRSGSRS